MQNLKRMSHCIKIFWAYLLCYCIDWERNRSTFSAWANEKQHSHSYISPYVFLDTISKDIRSNLKNKCNQYHRKSDWWHYNICFQKSITQYHSDKSPTHSLGKYHVVKTRKRQEEDRESLVNYLSEVYSFGSSCQVTKEDGTTITEQRHSEVRYHCCTFRHDETYIESITEPTQCFYLINVCTPNICSSLPSSRQNQAMSEKERKQIAMEVKDMFYHAYNNYMKHAFPLGDLKPISCEGQDSKFGELPMLTLIDTLDTLAIMGDAKEFRNAVRLIANGADFDIDTEVSVFETTIRVLGGLISSHLMAIDPKMKLYGDTDENFYDNSLLKLAINLADRLMPAFSTRTGIPYGTVNLRTGVLPDETQIASTAGAGSLSLEFMMLSAITSNPSYAIVARKAVKALYDHRTPLGLVGKHIHTTTGEWTEATSGLGTNSDSFYEYLLKMYILFDDHEAWEMFKTTYSAVLIHNKHGDWYPDVSIHDGCPKNAHFENLMAFWPGMQTLVGHLDGASRSINAFYQVWRDFGFIPEQFNVNNWQLLRKDGKRYPLRPELAESTYYMYTVTRDVTWLQAGVEIISSIQKHTRTRCGYASVESVETSTLEDVMPSFFLSETCKYLYLMFDPENWINKGNYIFSTEAHPFPVQGSISKLIGDTYIPPIDVIYPKCQTLPFYHNYTYNDKYMNSPSFFRQSCSFDKKRNRNNRNFKKIKHDIYGEFSMQNIGISIQILRIKNKEWLRLSNIGSSAFMVEEGVGKNALPKTGLFNIDKQKQYRCLVTIDETNEEIDCMIAGFGDVSDSLHAHVHASLSLSHTKEGCGYNTANYNGNILIVSRGECMFYEKAINAEDIGASALIVVNNEKDNSIMMMGGPVDEDDSNRKVSIPVIMVSYSTGKVLEKAVVAGLRATISFHSIDKFPHFPFIFGVDNLYGVYSSFGWGLIGTPTESRSDWQFTVVVNEESVSAIKKFLLDTESSAFKNSHLLNLLETRNLDKKEK